MDQSILPDNYELPETFVGKPYNYQHKGAAFLYAVKRGLLGDCTGSGKTPTSLLSMCLVQSRNIPKPKILIVTVNSCVLQWKYEVKRFTRGFRPVVLTAEFTPWNRREIALSLKPMDVCITNYSLMRNDTSREAVGARKGYRGWLESAGFDIVIFDEAAIFKNYTTAVFKAAKKIADRAQYVWALTAYAMSNNPLEVFGIYSVVKPNLFGVTYVDKLLVEHNFLGATKFRCLYTKQKEIRTARGGSLMVYAGGKNLGMLKDKISPVYLGRNYSDLGAELPELIEKKVVLQLGVNQKKAYAAVERKLLGTVAFQRIMGEVKVTQMDTPQNILVQMLHLQRLTNGLKFFDPRILSKYDENPKLDEICRLLDNEFSGEKVVIYSKFRTYIDILEKALKEYKPVRITGTEDQAIREFNKLKFLKEPDCRVMLMTRAGGMGLNLQSARAIFLVDAPFSFGELGQAVGRIRRIGSSHESVIVCYFVAEDTFDEHVLDVLRGKKQTIEAVFGAKDLMGTVDEETDENFITNVLARRGQEKGVI
jgi:SNF2 family DNA or RNA helicase